MNNIYVASIKLCFYLVIELQGRVSAIKIKFANHRYNTYELNQAHIVNFTTNTISYDSQFFQKK